MIHLKRSDSAILANPTGPRAACGAVDGSTIGLLAFEAAVRAGQTTCMFCAMELEALNAQLAAMRDWFWEGTELTGLNAIPQQPKPQIEPDGDVLFA